MPAWALTAYIWGPMGSQSTPDPPCTPWPNSACLGMDLSCTARADRSLVQMCVENCWLWPDLTGAIVNLGSNWGWWNMIFGKLFFKWDRFQWWIIPWLVVGRVCLKLGDPKKYVGDVQNCDLGYVYLHPLTVCIYIYSYLLARAIWTVDQRRSCGGSSSQKRGVYIYIYI